MDKKKLTLSVDGEVIEKAKRLGLNLSVIAENALKITSFGKEQDELVTKDKLVQAYQVVFQAMSPILKKWDTQIPIGEYSDFIDDKHEHYDTFTYYLTFKDIYLWDEIMADVEPLRSWKLNANNLPVQKFFDPERIIKELIDKLYQIEEENKIKMKKLEVITNLLKLSGLAEDDKK